MIATVTSEHPRQVVRCPLSSGERVGVRAVVIACPAGLKVIEPFTACLLHHTEHRGIHASAVPSGLDLSAAPSHG
jgi:hypothetical protein